jgi:hypothetical protein
VFSSIGGFVEQLHEWSDLDVRLAEGFPADAKDLMVIFELENGSCYMPLRDALDLLVRRAKAEYDLRLVWHASGKAVTVSEEQPGTWAGTEMDVERALDRELPVYLKETSFSMVPPWLEIFTNLSIRLEVDEETMNSLPSVTAGSPHGDGCAKLIPLRSILDVLVSTAQRKAGIPLQWKAEDTTVTISKRE